MGSEALNELHVYTTIRKDIMSTLDLIHRDLGAKMLAFNTIISRATQATQ
jgi:hypothetical protein